MVTKIQKDLLIILEDIAFFLRNVSIVRSPSIGKEKYNLVFPIPHGAVTNGNGDTTTVSRCANFDTF